MKAQQRRVSGYVLIEVVAAIVLLALVMVGVYAGLHANEMMVDYYVHQGEALDVLDNVVERAVARQPVSHAVCTEILKDEMARSPLGDAVQATAGCRVGEDRTISCTITFGRRTLATMRMGSHE